MSQTWKRPLPTNTGLDVISKGMICTAEGHVVRCDDPVILERIRSFLNASPVAFVIGPQDQLASATVESMDGDCDDLLFCDSPSKARSVLRSQEGKGQSVYGMFLCIIDRSHL